MTVKTITVIGTEVDRGVSSMDVAEAIAVGLQDNDVEGFEYVAERKVQGFVKIKILVNAEDYAAALNYLSWCWDGTTGSNTGWYRIATPIEVLNS